MHSKMMKVWFISIFGGSSCLLWHCRVTCDARVARVALSSRNCYGVSACMLKTFQHDGCSSCYFRATKSWSLFETVGETSCPKTTLIRLQSRVFQTLLNINQVWTRAAVVSVRLTTRFQSFSFWSAILTIELWKQFFLDNWIVWERASCWFLLLNCYCQWTLAGISGLQLFPAALFTN